MTNPIADFNNPVTLEKILTRPQSKALALSFLTCFLDIDIKDFGVSTLSSAPFVVKGAFSDYIEVIIEDTADKRHLVHFAFLDMHLGITNATIEFYDTNWERLKYQIESESYRYRDCRSIQQIYFSKFSISENTPYETIKTYSFEQPDYLLQFKFYELPKFDPSVSDIASEKEGWLYLFKNGSDMLHQLTRSNFTDKVTKALDLQKWTAADRNWYNERAKYRIERPKKMLERYLENEQMLDESFLEKPTQNGVWNWHFLEWQLGLLPQNKARPKDINITPLQADLGKFVFTLFRRWTANCKKKHPEIDLTIINEQVLIQDFSKELRQSFIALFDDETFYKRNMSQSYARNFVLGYIEGSLRVHWYMEYVIKSKEAFKTVMALKALSHFLTIEDVMRIQVERIYEEVIKSKVNLSNITFDIPKIDLKTEAGLTIETHTSKSNVQTVLNNLANEYTLKIQKMKVEHFEMDVEDVIEDSIINEFIKLNWGLFRQKMS
jgi:hypothetical protein